MARLASGGMTDVWLASIRADGFDKRVVLKTLRAPFTDDPLLLNVFLAEASISAKLVHPNVVEVLDFGEVEGTHFVAAEFVFGRTLGQIGRRLRKLSRSIDVWFPVRVALEVLEALGYIHSFQGAPGLVHRDVSSDNIMVAFTGLVKLLDFGIVAGNTTPSGGKLVGKCRYMSPERLVSSECGPPADIFAVGVVLYEYLTGVLPFECGEDPATAHALASVPPLSPVAHNPLVDDALARIILRALAPNPADRPQTADELAHELRRYLAKTEPDGLYNPLDSYVSDLFLGDSSQGAEPLSKLLAERRFPSPAPQPAPAPVAVRPADPIEAVLGAELGGPLEPIARYVPPTIPPVVSSPSRGGPAKAGSSPSRPPTPVAQLEGATTSPSKPPFAATPTPRPMVTTRPSPRPEAEAHPTPPRVVVVGDRARPTPPSRGLEPWSPEGETATDVGEAPVVPGQASPLAGAPPSIVLPPPPSEPVTATASAALQAARASVSPVPPPPSPPRSASEEDEAVELDARDVVEEAPAPAPAPAPEAPATNPLPGLPASDSGAFRIQALFEATRPPPRRADLFPTRPKLSPEDLSAAASKDIFAKKGTDRTHLAFSLASHRREAEASVSRLGSAFSTKKAGFESPSGPPLTPEAIKALEAFDRGLDYFGKKEHQRALAAWREAVSLDPSNRTYQANLRRLERLIGPSP